MLDRLEASQGWENLSLYLPEGALEGLRAGELRARSGLASTFVAGLELARRRIVALRQTRPFGPIALCSLQKSHDAEDTRSRLIICACSRPSCSRRRRRCAVKSWRRDCPPTPISQHCWRCCRRSTPGGG